MPTPAATSHAVVAAITLYRRLRELPRDELTDALHRNGYDLDADDLRVVEEGTSAATVDDLMAIAYALDVSLADLLSHVPADQPVPEVPVATGLPEDLRHGELRAWLRSTTALDRDARLNWHRNPVGTLRIRSVHAEDQLRGAQIELDDLGALPIREADMPPVQRLHRRIRDGEHDLVQMDIALAMAWRRLEAL